MWYVLAQKNQKFSGYFNPTPEEMSYELMDSAKAQVWYDFIANPNGRQRWNLIPAERAIKIWHDYGEFGVVRDENGINKIADIVVENIFKLWANTIFASHTEINPQYEIDDIYGENAPQFTEELQDKFADYIMDNNGMWRISDYAMQPLLNDALKILSANNSEDKLRACDMAFNRIHARSDIAGLFISGGVATLNKMAEKFDDELLNSR